MVNEKSNTYIWIMGRRNTWVYVWSDFRELYIESVICCHVTVVFMGSEKYPEENDFDDYVSGHGGHTNAWTDHERVSISVSESLLCSNSRYL